MRVYIAGPIAGKQDANRAAFSHAANWLTEQGYTPVNPHDVEPTAHLGDCPDGPLGGEGEHNAPCYMRSDIAALVTCEAVLMLRGWELSSGARTEFEVARSAGLRIWYEDHGDAPGDALYAGHIARQRAWSSETFGPGVRPGVVDHIRKELIEVEESDYRDLSEWVDVVILALDGAWRMGAEPTEIFAAIKAKQARNEARTWPTRRTADRDKAIEHVRVGED